jgi:glutamate dehydrogenase
VVVLKATSTCKGGAISASLEVLAGLVLTDAEFTMNMLPVGGGGGGGGFPLEMEVGAESGDSVRMPPFYDRFVKDIERIIARSATMEFQCIRTAHMNEPTIGWSSLSDQVQQQNPKKTRKKNHTRIQIRTPFVTFAHPQHTPTTHTYTPRG